jgi:low temperature requirement protein LtrA
MTVPRARTGRAAPRHASWLELFYDLLFVALFAQLADGLVEDLRPAVALGAIGLFAPAWWAWVSYTVSTNLFGEAGPVDRLILLVNMASLLVMTAGVESAFDGDPSLYAGGFAASRLVLVLLVAIWQLRNPAARAPVGSYFCYSTSVLLWGISIPLGPPAAYFLWALSIAIELAVRLREQTGARRAAMPALDVALLVERFGLLVIVALGEGVVQVATAMADAHGSSRAVITGVAAFVVLAALWWGYFDFASNTITPRFREQPHHTIGFARDVFVLGHLVLVGAIVTLSAGLGVIVSASATDEAYRSALNLTCDGLALYLVTTTLMSMRLGMRFSASMFILLPPLAVVGIAVAIGDRATPAVPVFVLGAALAGAAWLQRRYLAPVGVE